MGGDSRYFGNNELIHACGKILVRGDMKADDGLCNYLDSQHVFISLDAINLYPSVPFCRALETIQDFPSNLWVEIDDLGISVDDLIKML